MSNKYGILIETTEFADNADIADAVVATVREGAYDFVQLLAIPGTYDELSAVVSEKMRDVNVVVHAPMFMYEVDIGNHELLDSNLRKLRDSQKFADLLRSEIIVLHPGEGEGEEFLEESIRQAKILNDSRVAIENLPHNPRPNRKMCGTTPEQIKKIIDEVGCKFCFDLAHAICAANSLGLDVDAILAGFYDLRPSIYHVSDGKAGAVRDYHMHLGEGDYNLQRIFERFISEDSIITLETRKNGAFEPEVWLKDAAYARNLEKNCAN